MNIIRLSLIVSTLLMFFSCNVGSIRKARLENKAEKQKSAQVDSFLYYQPVVLNDPFLDSLKNANDQEQLINIRVIPPPKPPTPNVKQVDGYRVQTFAGVDSLNALVMVNNLKAVLNDSVYFFKEKGLFKIQLGDYLYRNDADLKVLDLRKDGFSGAWVVQRLINVPMETDSTSEVEKNDIAYPYKIQILVTADEEKAKSLTNQLKMQFNMESIYTRTESVFKIFLGKFSTREAAEKTLNTVRENGYKDAWLVHDE
jgi:SPOR domain